MASGGYAPTELSEKLHSKRLSVEKAGETWESAPAESSADASHFKGLQFAADALGAGEWLAQKVTDTPEEDIIVDALQDVIKSRGERPAHAPSPTTSEDSEKLMAMSDHIMQLQRTKLREIGELQQERELVAKREAEVAALEEEHRKAKEEHQRRQDELLNYPRPSWLDKCEGTINVAVTGNSGIGKSLLINRLRRLKSGAHLWAPVGVRETTMAPTMYTFPGRQDVRLWDLPGADTENFPRESYIRNMGLRYFDSVLIVSAGRFTSTEVELRKELELHGVPFLIVRTKCDIDVWNNHMDNKLSEEETVKSIRDDLQQQHGVQKAYLVSSREGDRDLYDMPNLMRDAFPGLKKVLDANAPVFEPGDTSGWGDAWALPSNSSTLISGIQGQWADRYDGCLYTVDGSEVHVTLPDGRAAIVTLTEDARGIWWNNRWCIEMSSVAKARQSGELRWAPSDLTMKPLVWRWAEGDISPIPLM